MNMAIAEHGLKSESRSGCAGKPWNLMKIEDREGPAFRYVLPCSLDARMAGQLPTMSAAGSGNQGITAIIPVALVGESMGKPRERLPEL